MAVLEVNFAIDNPEVKDIWRLKEAMLHIIHIRQLIAIGIYSKEVGIALHEEQLVGEFILGQPRTHAGLFWIEVPVIAIRVVLIPALKAGFLGRCFQSRLVVGQIHVELRHVVARFVERIG